MKHNILTLVKYFIAFSILDLIFRHKIDLLNSLIATAFLFVVDIILNILWGIYKKRN